METKREGAYKSLEKELEQLGRAQKELHDTAHDLESALRSSSTRGRWGEMKLKRIVELAGLQKHVDYDDQVTTQSDDSSIRPDMVVYLPNKGIIVIDSKAPLKAYLDSSEQDNPDIAKELLIKHAQATRAFMRSLHQKSYWSQFENSPELVVMFVPLESALYAAFENDNTNKLEGFTFCSAIKLVHLKAAIAVFPHPGGDITTILFENFSSIISFCSLEGIKIDEASFLIFQIF